MADQTPPNDPAVQTPAPAPAAPAAPVTPAMSEKEIADGKVFAILCYAINFVGLPFWLVPLIMRNNDFSLYHSKQCLIMWLIGVAASVIAIIPCVGWVIAIVAILGLLVFNVMGLINAINAKAKPLPLIGVYAEKWFEGLRKVPA